MPEFSKGQRVRFIRPPLASQFRNHYNLSLRYLDRGMIYEVEHYFLGEPAQIELKGIEDMLFHAEMFDLVG